MKSQNEDLQRQLKISGQEKQEMKKTYEEEIIKLNDVIEMEGIKANDIRMEMSKSVEKRLEELTKERNETSALKTESRKTFQQIEEFKITLKRNETMFQRTLEQDRSNIQKEMKIKLTRVKKLEDEKISLLQEMEDLISQITSIKKELKDVEGVAESLRVKSDATQIELKDSQSRLSEACSELKQANSRENELKDQILKLEMHFNESTSRLEADLKQNKKNAAQQVIDISSKNKAYECEIETYRAQYKKLGDEQKEYSNLIEKMKGDMDLAEKGSLCFLLF